MNNWELVFEKYKENYKKIFDYLYPSKGSTGFTERNLSVNFTKAYEAVNTQAITWYEFSFEKGKHLDAVIIDPNSQKIIIVESKRFSNPEIKVKEVDDDIDRILGFSNNLESEFKNRINNIDKYSILGVILADVWTENEQKTSIQASFESDNYLSNYLCNYTKVIINPIYFCLNFKDTVFLNEIEKKHKAIKDTYNLVGLIWTIKES